MSKVQTLMQCGSGGNEQQPMEETGEAQNRLTLTKGWKHNYTREMVIEKNWRNGK